VTGGVPRRLPFFLGLVVLAGCGGAHTSATVAVPQGFAVRSVEQPAFSLALPKEWRSFGDRSHMSAKEVAGTNQRLRLELETLAKSDSPIKLVAFDPASGQRFHTNMNVLQTGPLPSKLSFDDMAKTEVQQISRASGIKHIRQQVTVVPAGRALHLTYRPRPNAVIQQYFVRHGSLLYVLTYSTRAAEEARFAQVFDKSAHTFQVG
jgi:hypothetical protein